MSKSAYIYLIIRYVHDVNADESLNVAVMLWSEDEGLFFRAAPSLSRIQAAFPNVDVSALRESLDLVVKAIRGRTAGCDGVDFIQVTSLVLPESETSLRVSKPGFGMADDMALEADALLERFVLRCDHSYEVIDVTLEKESRRHWSSIRPRDISLSCGNDDYFFADSEVMPVSAVAGG